MEVNQWGGRGEELGGKIWGMRIIGRHKIDRGEVKNSVGSGEAKEHMYDPWT